jgi:hypothetical protein
MVCVWMDCSRGSETCDLPLTESGMCCADAIPLYARLTIIATVMHDVSDIRWVLREGRALRSRAE